MGPVSVSWALNWTRHRGEGLKVALGRGNNRVDGASGGAPGLQQRAKRAGGEGLAAEVEFKVEAARTQFDAAYLVMNFGGGFQVTGDDGEAGEAAEAVERGGAGGNVLARPRLYPSRHPGHARRPTARRSHRVRR